MQRPNILVLYTDQQRWDTIGANGNPHIITPNLDRLAEDGTTFTHHFVQHPLCMPSRVSMLSGQYPATLGITHMGVPVPEDLLTLPKMLTPYGYHTANIGKLHFLPHANRDHRIPHPDFGFDHLEISDEPGVYEDAYRAWVRSKKPAQLDRLSVGLPPATSVWRQQMPEYDDGVQHPFEAGRDDFVGAVPFPADEDLTHTAFVAEQTIAFIQQRSTSTQPFLCIAGFYAPHAPWVVPQRFLDMYKPEQLPLPHFPVDVNAKRPTDPTARFSDAQLQSAKHGYYAMITEVDHHVGRILDTLETIGIVDNTIVVFTSDHGEWLGDHLRYAKGYPGDDAVSRVPLIIRTPDSHSLYQNRSIVEAVDIVPTLLELAGIQVPPSLQGRSLVSLLHEHDTVPQTALMEGNGWKNLRTQRYRYLIHADGTEALWDTQYDPGEYRNVVHDPAYKDAVAECRHLMLKRLLEMEQPQPRTWVY